MKKLAQENLIAVGLLFVFAGVIYLCQDFGPRARMIPLPLAIGGIVLTLIQLVWQNVRSTDELQMDLISVDDKLPAVEAADTPEPPPSHAGPRGPEWLKELRAFGIVALLIALVLIVGIIPAVFVFTAGYFVLTRHYSWWMGLAYTSIFTASIYVLFIMALQIEPYHGLLTPIVERFR